MAIWVGTNNFRGISFSHKTTLSPKFNSHAFEMAQENVIFQQRTTSKGKTEYRTKFGRQKALVFRKHVGFFYIELYDNKPGKSDRIRLGLDELDYLIQLRPNLETLKPGFTEVSPDVIQL